jgi:hypothetical protein
MEKSIRGELRMKAFLGLDGVGWWEEDDPDQATMNWAFPCNIVKMLDLARVGIIVFLVNPIFSAKNAKNLF